MVVFLSSHNLMANKLYRNKITTQALRFAAGPTLKFWSKDCRFHDEAMLQR